MATLKFKGNSPYGRGKDFPKEDYLHKQYNEQVSHDTSNKTKSPPVGAAIFGLGRAGSIHLSNIVGNDRIKLHYVVENITTKWEGIKKYWNLNDATFLTSKDEDKVFNDSRINVIFVASLTHTHEGIVTKAIEKKIAVFCEKPIAQNVEATARCYAKAEKLGVPLLSAFNRRFDPAYSALRDRVRKGDVGHVQMIKTVARDSPLPTVEYLKQSGGVFHDCIVHDIDMATWVLGELPVKVQATATALIPEIKAIDDFDTVGVLLTFPSGTVAFLDNSRYSCYGYDQRLEVFGADGMLKVENERPCHSTEAYLGFTGETFNPIYYSFPSRYKLAYKNELEHFLNVVQNGEPLKVLGYQTLAVSKITTAAEESARTGKTILLDWSKDGIPSVYS